MLFLRRLRHHLLLLFLHLAYLSFIIFRSYIISGICFGFESKVLGKFFMKNLYFLLFFLLKCFYSFEEFVSYCLFVDWSKNFIRWWINLRLESTILVCFSSIQLLRMLNFELFLNNPFFRWFQEILEISLLPWIVSFWLESWKRIFHLLFSYDLSLLLRFLHLKIANDLIISLMYRYIFLVLEHFLALSINFRLLLKLFKFPFRA